VTRQRTLAEPTDLAEPIWQTAMELARPELRGIHVRLLGVGTSGFAEREQMTLFEEEAAGEGGRRRRATEAADAVRRRFGDKAVTRARLLGSGLPAPFERDPMKPIERRTGMNDPRPER
jgi:DNA polymerase-4